MRSRVYVEDGWECVYCGRFGRDLTCDHVVPVSRGGASVFDNLLTSCRSCNSGKGSRSVQEAGLRLRYGRFYRPEPADLQPVTRAFSKLRGQNERLVIAESLASGVSFNRLAQAYARYRGWPPEQARVYLHNNYMVLILTSIDSASND